MPIATKTPTKGKRGHPLATPPVTMSEEKKESAVSRTKPVRRVRGIGRTLIVQNAQKDIDEKKRKPKVVGARQEDGLAASAPDPASAPLPARSFVDVVTKQVDKPADIVEIEKTDVQCEQNAKGSTHAGPDAVDVIAVADDTVDAGNREKVKRPRRHRKVFVTSTHAKSGQNVVTKANALIEANYKLPIDQMRFIYAALANVKSDEELNERTFYMVEPSDLLNAGVSAKKVRDVMNASRKIFKNSIVTIPCKNGATIETHWVHSIIYYPDGKVGVMFSPIILPYICGLKKNFTSFALSVGNLSTVYAMRIYEHVARFRKTGICIVKIRTLVERLQIPKSYQGDQINRRILTPAVKEINEYSDLTVEFEFLEKKENRRSYESVVFRIRAKRSNQKKATAKNLLKPLTETQILLFANLLFMREDFRAWFEPRIPGTAWADAVPEIIRALNVRSEQDEFFPWLEKVGYDAVKKLASPANEKSASG